MWEGTEGSGRSRLQAGTDPAGTQHTTNKGSEGLETRPHPLWLCKWRAA